MKPATYFYPLFRADDETGYILLPPSVEGELKGVASDYSTPRFAAFYYTLSHTKSTPPL